MTTFRDMPLAVRIAIGFVILFVLFALFGGFLTPYDFRQTSLLDRFEPPVFLGGTWDHVLGTDGRGRDLLARLAMGAKVTLLVAIFGTLIGAVFGSLLGLIAGGRRGKADTLIMMAVDVQASVPIIIIALFVLALFKSSLLLIVIMVGFSGWENYARLVRASTLSVRERGYVTAERVLGASSARIYLRYILPNIFNVILVQFTINLPLTVLLETALSFLGLGVQPPMTSLGQIMSDGRDRLLTSWWLTMFPGAIIFFLALSVSIVGDWLRDQLDPTLRNSGRSGT
ncbi:ABC transporter permease [Martelella lutilitoris]|uniref:ABC transporter permease n=1 Tax=Martelella lutilitoris TaxID=2583532 RepID=A0A7T7HN51_9HYPH|nr:ABC transporter permease [Martelella lutilitoris]QQM32227.1 ABC transporter permease [Martelella lutilitoris]